MMNVYIWHGIRAPRLVVNGREVSPVAHVPIGRSGRIGLLFYAKDGLTTDKVYMKNNFADQGYLTRYDFEGEYYVAYGYMAVRA